MHATVQHSLDPGKARRTVGSDLGSNCLKKLSVDNNSRHQQAKSEFINNTA